MAPSLRGLALLSADSLLTHTVYVLVAVPGILLYGAVLPPSLVGNLIAVVVFVMLYYVIYRVIGRVSVPRPPNGIDVPDGTAPFKIPFASRTGENEDFESTAEYTQYMTGNNASSYIGFLIAFILYIVTAAVWSILSLLWVGVFPTIANVLYHMFYLTDLPFLVMAFSSIATGLWIGERLMHQYSTIFPDSHIRPLDTPETQSDE